MGDRSTSTGTPTTKGYKRFRLIKLTLVTIDVSEGENGGSVETSVAPCDLTDTGNPMGRSVPRSRNRENRKPRPKRKDNLDGTRDVLQRSVGPEVDELKSSWLW